MRTTLTIDDDILVAARGLAARQQKTIGEVISALSRQALQPPDRRPEAPRPSHLLTGLCALPGHAFWPDAISLRTHAATDPARLLVSGQVTDSYLLALAQSRGGYLASFDHRLVTDAVADGRKALRLIG